MFLVMLLWNYSVLVDASGIFSIRLALLHRGMRCASVAMDFFFVYRCKPVVSGFYSWCFEAVVMIVLSIDCKPVVSWLFSLIFEAVVDDRCGLLWML